MVKHVARLDGESFCPYCHKLMKAIIKQNIRTLLNHPGLVSKMMKDYIHVIYNNVYNTLQEKIVFFETGTPVLMINNKFFYTSIISDKLADKFLEKYFENKWRGTRKV